MSGIAAWVSDAAPPGGWLRPMDARGPTAVVEDRAGRVGLGMAVLSPSEDVTAVGGRGAWRVVADGELAHLGALRAELGLALPGRPAAATVDVLAALLDAQGVDRVHARTGRGLAWIATDGKVLVAARDAAGERPLFRGRTPDGAVVVASDPEVCFRAGVSRASSPLDDSWEASLGFVPAPSTRWEAVTALLPGEVWTLDLATGASTSRIDARVEGPLNPDGIEGSRPRWTTSIGYAFALAVRLRAHGDAGVAVALSGQASRAVLAQACLRRKGPIFAVSWQIADNAQEVADAAAWCEARGVAHRIVQVDGPDADEVREDLLRRGRPATEADVAWTLLARAAWEGGAEVLLHGVGAAELWGGASPLRNLAWTAVPGVDAVDRLRHRLVGRPRPPWPASVLGAAGVLAPGAPLPEAMATLAETAPVGSLAGRSRWLLRRLLADGALQRIDLACADTGLRARGPFVDPAFASLVQQVPAGMLARVGADVLTAAG